MGRKRRCFRKEKNSSGSHQTKDQDVSSLFELALDVLNTHPFLFQRAESEGAEGTGSGTPGASAIATVAANLDTSSSDVPPSPASPGTEAGGQKESKKKKNRCLACKKKVGLTGES